MKNLICSLKALIVKAGEIAVTIRNSGLIINYKTDNSPVTNADKKISELIYNNLQVLTPNINIICEERSLIHLNSNIFWLVDPIDGTKSYIKGDNTYTINIGLIKNGIPIIGLIYQPSINKLYYTDINGYLKIEQNAIELPLNNISEQSNIICATITSGNLNLDTQNFLMKHSIKKIISIPSSIKLCLIAEGTADIYPKFGTTMEWDIAAGHALIRSIGGNVVDHNGKELRYGKENFQNPNFFAYSNHWLKKKTC